MLNQFLGNLLVKWNKLTAPENTDPVIANQEYLVKSISYGLFIIYACFYPFVLVAISLGVFKLPDVSLVAHTTSLSLFALSAYLVRQGHWQKVRFLSAVAMLALGIADNFAYGFVALVAMEYTVVAIISTITIVGTARLIALAMIVASFFLFTPPDQEFRLITNYYFLGFVFALYIGIVSYLINFLILSFVRSISLTNEALGVAEKESSERKKTQGELSQRVDELERMNDLIVERELRMVDLKKQLAEYKDKDSAADKNSGV